jgi:hypothetical protein
MHPILATQEQVELLNSADLSAVDHPTSRHDVAISLTTVPGRLGTLKAVLYCLMDQSLPGIPIELHIARRVRSTSETWPPLPRWLQELRAVRVVEHAEDLGPAMKFIPALRADRERSVIVVDDDVLYPRDLAEGLLVADACCQGRSAICYRGWRIHPALSWERSVLTVPREGEPVDVGIVTGHGGYCLRSSRVDLASLCDLSTAPEECYMMDDIWISAHLSRNRTAKRLIRGSDRFKIPIPSALGGERERRNDVALSWFKADWRDSDIDGHPPEG